MICPFCGAYSPRKCDLSDADDCCPWEESGEYERMLEMDDEEEADDD